MGTPLAGAAALRPGRSWALLHRSPEFLDDPQELPEGLRFVVRVETPPKLSTLVVSRARALLAAAGDAEDLVGHVKCADAEGDILLMVWSADEQGWPASPPRLLVCRPESDTVDLVPPVPDQLGGLDSSAPLGIVRAAAPPGPRGAGHYLIAQLQRAGPSSFPTAAAQRMHQIAGRADSSSSSSAAAGAHQRALVFSSSSSTWSTKVVRPRRFHASSSEDEASWSMVKEDEDAQPLVFEAHDVLSHDSAGLLAFLDVQHGLVLFFHPLDAAARFVEFPAYDRDPFGLEELLDDEELEAVVPADDYVAFSQGSLCLLRVFPDSGRISMMLLRDEEENRWVKVFHVAGDEIYSCDSSIADHQRSVEPGAVDPTDRCQLVFFMPEAERAFMVAVNPKSSYLTSVSFLKQAVNAGHNCWSDVVIWRSYPAAAVAQGNKSVSTAGGHRSSRRGWTLSRKGMGRMARSAFKFARKHIHKVQPVADLAGTTAELFGVPYASKVSPTVAGLVKGNQAAYLGEEVLKWWNKPSPKDDNVVGTIQDAEDVIREWVVSEKPKGQVVTLAPELSHNELLNIRNVFRRRGAEELMPLPPDDDDDDDYDMVGTAPRYFPR
ncbi:unnamed protein product [Urochloa decumbens]|uniref:DUF295 domain-containing protein n=1 Tax=Urochloa decumbens TaxID=240449 RepID=A0ABC9H111_9POAL